MSKILTRTQFLVRRETGEVWIFTERLREAYPELEEVWADDVKSAATKPGMPDPQNLSLEALEALDRVDLAIFAQTRIPGQVKITPNISREDLLLAIKEAVLTGGPESATLAPEQAPVADQAPARKPAEAKPDPTLEEAISRAAAKSLKEGDEYFGKEDYAVTGMAGFYKADPEDVRAKLKAAIAALLPAGGVAG